MKLLKEIGVKPILIWGLEKDNITKEIKDVVVDPGGGGLTKGEIAVALSHAKALRWVVENNCDAIIIEDDFRLWHEGGITANMIKPAWDSVPAQTDFCSFSKHHIWNPELEFPNEINQDSENYKRVLLPTYGNQCYYIGAHAAHHFYKESMPIRVAADVLYRYPGKEMVFRHHFPELIWHQDQSSIKD
jgi:GR25 family glycosyltransferase involved in LPS biosynthesis